jgi:actin-like ATPase involved in cell morphogenesis
MTVAVDLGSASVKVAADAHSEVRQSPAVDPELAVRVGTTVPLVRRDGPLVTTQPPHEAYVRGLAEAVDGMDAERVAIVAPDWWTKRARAMVEEALHGPGRFRLVSPAVCAARAAGAAHRLPASVAVLDVGAESSSATIVAADDGGHRVVGRPAVLHGQAGNHIDRRLMQHVLGWLSTDIEGFAPTDAQVAAAGGSLQSQVKAAKELLSVRPVATVTPDLPGSKAELRLVRAEFDEVIRETVDAIVGMLKANILLNAPDGVGAVLLTGGSVSIPLVPQVISAELGLPVILERDPSTLAVRGATTVELPEPERRHKRFRRRRDAGAAGIGPIHAPKPHVEPYVDTLVKPSSVPSAVPAGRHAASRQAARLPATAATEIVTETAGPKPDTFLDISRRQAEAVRPEGAQDSAHLVVETEPGPRARPTTRWASSSTTESSWDGARQVVVDGRGHFTLRVNERDQDVDMGARLASSSLTLILMGLHVFVTVTETGALVRDIVIDPDDHIVNDA